MEPNLDYYTTTPSVSVGANVDAPQPPDYVGTMPRLVRPPQDQDRCMQAAATIRDDWIRELELRNNDMRLLRPIIVRDRQWRVALTVVSVLSLFALGLVLSWYIPLKIRTDKQANSSTGAQ